ncbi:hypothetical protein KP509_24G074800 [Ceratopteris richardii]|uniref:Uncharacterized protein n=1 Tax=Ceratopteris richardii TaxID=49495 RepID=A0A8T2RYC0_CERRI|nr:hypothetical protein KP509_24G074800 [Ceratopteris richardii]
MTSILLPEVLRIQNKRPISTYSRGGAYKRTVDSSSGREGDRAPITRERERGVQSTERERCKKAIGCTCEIIFSSGVCTTDGVSDDNLISFNCFMHAKNFNMKAITSLILNRVNCVLYPSQ